MDDSRPRASRPRRSAPRHEQVGALVLVSRHRASGIAVGPSQASGGLGERMARRVVASDRCRADESSPRRCGVEHDSHSNRRLQARALGAAPRTDYESTANGLLRTEPPIRDSPTASKSGLYRDGDRDHGPGHRSKHGDLQHRQRGAVPAAAVRGAVRADSNLHYRHRRHDTGGRVVSGLSRLSRAQGLVLRSRR